MFVELFDLKLCDDKKLDGFWEETARWVKYEEDVEGVDHRWGQPHVACLSMRSIFHLRKCVSKGILIPNSKAKNFKDVCNQIADSMVTRGCALDSERISKFLMLKHMYF